MIFGSAMINQEKWNQWILLIINILEEYSVDNIIEGVYSIVINIGSFSGSVD